jgi:DNA-binding transcriptional ArsR family regulator
VASAATLMHAAPLFAALGDATRLQMLGRLSEGPLSIAQLARGAAISRQAITKHLHALSAAGLAHSERCGRETRWRLEFERLAEARRCLEEISRQWDQALGRLAAFVQADD